MIRTPNNEDQRMENRKVRAMNEKEFAELERLWHRRLPLTQRQQRRRRKLMKLDMPPPSYPDKGFVEWIAELQGHVLVSTAE